MLHLSQMDSPIGTLGIAESEIGLRRILFQNEYPFETSLKKYYPKEEINFVQTPAKEIQNQIIAYFKGELKSFSLALDLKAPPFFKYKRSRCITGNTRPLNCDGVEGYGYYGNSIQYRNKGE